MLASSTISTSNGSGSSALWRKPPGPAPSRRWSVRASSPTTSPSRRAAFPVGAASATDRPSARRQRTSARVVVVLPTPGPPVSTKQPLVAAVATAWRCSSESPRDSASAASQRSTRRAGRPGRRASPSRRLARSSSARTSPASPIPRPSSPRRRDGLRASAARSARGVDPHPARGASPPACSLSRARERAEGAGLSLPLSRLRGRGGWGCGGSVGALRTAIVPPASSCPTPLSASSGGTSAMAAAASTSAGGRPGVAVLARRQQRRLDRRLDPGRRGVADAPLLAEPIRRGEPEARARPPPAGTGWRSGSAARPSRRRPAGAARYRVSRPCSARNAITSRSARCSAQAAAMARARCGPIPGTSRTRSGEASSTSSVRSPNVPTIRFARTGPIWRTSPEPRYRTMPSTSLGRRTSRRGGAELRAVARIGLPAATQRQHLAGLGSRQRPDDGDRVAPTAHAQPHDAEAVRRVVERDALDGTVERDLRLRRRRCAISGHESIRPGRRYL